MGFGPTKKRDVIQTFPESLGPQGESQPSGAHRWAPPSFLFFFFFFSFSLSFFSLLLISFSFLSFSLSLFSLHLRLLPERRRRRSAGRGRRGGDGWCGGWERRRSARQHATRWRPGRRRPGWRRATRPGGACCNAAGSAGAARRGWCTAARVPATALGREAAGHGGSLALARPGRRPSRRFGEGAGRAAAAARVGLGLEACAAGKIKGVGGDGFGTSVTWLQSGKNGVVNRLRNFTVSFLRYLYCQGDSGGRIWRRERPSMHLCMFLLLQVPLALAAAWLARRAARSGA